MHRKLYPSVRGIPLKSRLRKLSRRLGLLAALVGLLFLISLVLPRFRQGKMEQGKVSWYGGRFHGRLTASGNIFNMLEYTAASPTLPLGTLVKVSNPANGKEVLVQITDRGPYAVDDQGRVIRPLRPHPDRALDLSFAAARQLGIVNAGVAKVEYQPLVNNLDGILNE